MTTLIRNLQTLGELFELWAEYGERPALVAFGAESAETWSYSRLRERVDQLARGLAHRGLEKGHPVALFGPDRPEWIMAALAAVRAGAVAMPVDAQLGDEVLGHVLADSGARFVFTTADRVARLERLAPAITPILLDDETRGWRARLVRDTRAFPAVGPEDGATLFYTSGTTGRPKGVPLTHGNLAFQVNTLRAAGLVGPEDRVALPLPLHHVYPFVMGMLVPLALGLPIIIPQALTGPQILRALREGETTVMVGVPRLYSAMVAGIRARVQSRGGAAAGYVKLALAASTWLRRHLGLHWGRRLLAPLHHGLAPRLRLLSCGGAALDPELAWTLEGMGWRLGIGYGLTETAPLLTLSPPGSSRLDTVGQPIPGVELRIDVGARPEEAEGLPAGAGEIQARGPNVFSGYRNLPEKTREAFTADGWSRTGDLGYIHREGDLHIIGRVSELIVTEGGENITPEEVEAVYLRHAFIREFAMLQKEGRLVALILPDSGAIRHQGYKDITAAVREAVAEAAHGLPSYQRVSDFAVTRDPLPRTRLGKLRRHQLVQCFDQAKTLEGRPEAMPGPLPMESWAEPDRALLENAAARDVWAWLAARFPRRHLTPDTSLQLDLGVDSLAWLDIALEIQTRTGAELTEEALSRSRRCATCCARWARRPWEAGGEPPPRRWGSRSGCSPPGNCAGSGLSEAVCRGCPACCSR